MEVAGAWYKSLLSRGSQLFYEAQPIRVDFTEYLPVEITQHILHYLEFGDLKNCGRVCKSWNGLTLSDHQFLFSQGVIHESLLPHLRIASSTSFKTGNSKPKSEPRQQSRMNGTSFYSLKYNQHLLSACLDGFIRIYDIDTGVLVGAFRAHSSDVYCLALWNDVIFSGGQETAIRAWRRVPQKLSEPRSVGDSGEGLYYERVASLEGHIYPGGVKCIKVWRNYLFSCGKDGRIIQWEIQKCGKEEQKFLEYDTLVPMRYLTGHENWVYFIEIWYDFLVTSGRDGKIRIWNILPEVDSAAYSAVNGEGESLKSSLCSIILNHSFSSVFALTVWNGYLISAGAGIRIWRMPKMLKQRGRRRAEALKVIFKQQERSHLSIGIVGLTKPQLTISSTGEIWPVKVTVYDFSEKSLPCGYSIRSILAWKSILIAGGRDGGITVWNLLRGECIKTFKYEDDVVYYHILTHNNSFVLSAGHSGPGWRTDPGPGKIRKISYQIAREGFYSGDLLAI